MSDYILPEVWENPTSMGGTWGGLNQPTAGARFEQTLPKGDQPFQLYTFPTPNGIKATIMLEELKELGVTQAGYDAYRIKIGDGDQFGSDFVAINPNSKIPAMMDYSEDQPVRVFSVFTFSLSESRSSFFSESGFNSLMLFSFLSYPFFYARIVLSQNNSSIPVTYIITTHHDSILQKCL